MKIAVVGYETEGRVSYEYFTKRGHDVTICDVQADKVIPDGAKAQLGTEYLNNLDQFDLIVRSAGINPNIILGSNPTVTDKITTAINEFLAACPTKNIIGITGTKGKGTTSTLTALMLEAAGKRVHLGGNIGRSPLEFIDEIQPDDWIVLELSSFQLQDAKHSPHIATCLMVVPEHLNWHHDMADYVHAKSNLFKWQTKGDVSIYFAENATSQQIAAQGDGVMIPYFAEPGAHITGDAIVIDRHTICKTHELRLLGQHNWQNACAAVTTVWQVVQDADACAQVLKSFAGLEHRLEFVREYNAVRYYDDSFGTTPETAIVAMQAFTEPKVVILGGSDKGASFADLAQTVVNSQVRAVVCIGGTGPAIAHELQSIGYNNIIVGAQTMPEIVRQATEAAQPGDVVLLSTGCASFGLFADYKDRGNQFKAAVQSLS